MGAPFLALFATLAWATTDCPDRQALLDVVQAAVVEADLDAAEAGLSALEDAFACGTVADPQQLARMWLLEGAWLSFIGDTAGAIACWNAANRVAPNLWIPDLGDELRADYETATPLDGSGHIDVEPVLFWGSIAAVDGQMTALPLEVAPGLHLVQAGTAGDEIAIGRIISVTPNSTAVVATGLMDPAQMGSAAPAEPVVVAVESKYPIRAHIGVGATVAIGDAISGARAGDEPADKLSVPLELGL